MPSRFRRMASLPRTSSTVNTARLWDLQTGRELRRFIGHTGPVEWAAFSPDGKTFVTGSDVSTARIWSVDYRDTVNYPCSNLLRDFTDEELVALETDTIDAEVKRLVKVSHIAATIGRVMWVWFRHQGKAEEEESSG